MAHHEDFGEKIGGARKDLWSAAGLNLKDLDEMNEAERKKFVTKDNVWKRPDYQKLMSEGIPRRVAYFIKCVRDALPTEPYILWGSDTESIAAAQDRYVGFVSGARDAAMALTTEKDIAGFFDRNFASHVSTVRGYFVKVDDELRGLITNKVLALRSMESLSRLNMEVARKQFGYSEDEKILSRYRFHQYDGEIARFSADDRNDRPCLKIKFGYGVHYCYPAGEMADQSKWEKGTWFAERNGTVTHINAPDLDTLKQTVLDYEHGKGLGQLAKAQATRKGRFVPPQLAHVRFAGADIRHGRSMVGKDYLSTFKFRGGEFGNWMSDNDRQASLNMGYEALAVMAKALNVSLEDISLGGRLAIAFGARGQGAAAAHYEPMREVINLTKMHGAGSLAHEWGHAMDDILAKTISADGLSDGIRRGLTETQTRLYEHLKYGPAKDYSVYYRESKDFGKQYSKTDHGYWESECEMFARAFACYVHDKLDEAGITCDYLVGHAEAGPVPHGEERKQLNADFDALIVDFKGRGLLHDYVEPQHREVVRPSMDCEMVTGEQLTLDGLMADALQRSGNEQHDVKGKEQER